MKLDAFKKGQRVRVVRAIESNDRYLLGRELEVDRVETAHGYVVARVIGGDIDSKLHGKWWLRPDALEIVA